MFLQRQVEALKLQLGTPTPPSHMLASAHACGSPSLKPSLQPFPVTEKESMKSIQSELQVREHRQRLVELQAAVQASGDKAVTISIDMARQYRSMREDLQEQIDTLQARLVAQAEQQKAAEQGWAAERAEWEAKLAACQELVVKERERSAELSAEFGSMLQRTLDTMGQRMEVTNEWEGDADGQPTVRLYEEFTYKR